MDDRVGEGLPLRVVVRDMEDDSVFDREAVGAADMLPDCENSSVKVDVGVALRLIVGERLEVEDSVREASDDSVGVTVGVNLSGAFASQAT